MANAGDVIHGRPDLQGRGMYGVTLAKRHPKYVYSRRGGSLLHLIERVELWWWEVGPGGHTLVRRASPKMHAHTRCGYFVSLTDISFIRKLPVPGRTCEVPSPDAVLCGRCHGEPASFSRNGAATKAGLDRRAARARIGCEEVASVDE